MTDLLPVMDAGEKQPTSCADRKLSDILRPASIDDFFVLKPISRGAFGKVYLARKKCNPRLYAIKVVKKSDMHDKNLSGQMKAERDALALSKSPFVVHLFYCLQTATKVYLVMEYLIGGDVKSLLHTYGYFDEDMSVKYISEVARALDYLHRHGIIHRDLKPDNMLVSNEGHIKLTDFGLSKVKLDRELSLADILTTPSLAKPKQDYFRTPGQVLSLISSLGLNTPAGESKRRSSASAVFSPLSCGKTDQWKNSLCSPLRRQMEYLRSPVSHSQTLGPVSFVFSPNALTKSLTPRLLKSRRRFDTMSAGSSQSCLFPSTTDSEGGVSPLWEVEQKERENFLHLYGRNTSGPTKGKSTSDMRLQRRDSALASLDNLDLRGQLHREPSAGELSKKAKEEPLAWKRLQFNEVEQSTPPQKPDLSQPIRGYVSGVEGHCATEGKPKEGHVVVTSAGKRVFEEVERSSEQLESLSKKSNSAYQRCYGVPDIALKNCTGLTGLFANVHLEMFGSEGQETSEGRATKLSSPIALAKNLLCELDGPAEWVFIEGTSFGEDHELSRSLCADSKGSAHEMSIDNSPTPKRSAQSAKEGHWALFELDDRSYDPAISPSTPVLPQPPIFASTGTAKPGNGLTLRGGESKRSFLDRVPELNPRVAMSPSFLKPRNAVSFRSYCSSINRPNMSGSSRLSLGSVEAMDMATSTSYHSMPSVVTPVQNRPSSNNSLDQTPQSSTTSHTPFRTPKSVRRGPVPVEGVPILGTPDYLAPELLLGKPHDCTVDWWALGVCLFEFLTGVPPFNDETPQLVFQNILNRDIPWPDGEEELSHNSRNAIEILLTVDMNKRAGFKELRSHTLFAGLDWDNLQNQTMPFIPQPEDETDTSYFDARNTAQHLVMSGFSL